MPHRASFGFIFAIVCIDMLGFGIVIPVLPGLIMHLGHKTIDAAALYAGWLGAGYAATQFVFAPIIGNLSDRFGRRPVLLASVGAMAVDYAIQGFAPALWWLAVGRLVAGMAGASYTAAYAAIADFTPPEKRAGAFGMMGMAFGFGFVVGPALGGLLAEYGERAPFLFAAGLAALNFLFGLVFLRESLPADSRRAFDWKRANAFSALNALKGQSRRVLWFSFALGTWQLAHVVYPAVWTYFAIDAYHFTPRQVGIALGCVGLSSTLVQGFALRKIVARVGEAAAVIIGVACFAVAAVLYALVDGMPWLALPIAIGAFQGLVQPSISALNSRAIDARSQGELQGAVQSLGAIAAIIGPPLYSGLLAQFSGPNPVLWLPAMPLLAAALVAFVALGLFLAGRSRDESVGAVKV